MILSGRAAPSADKRVSLQSESVNWGSVLQREKETFAGINAVVPVGARRVRSYTSECDVYCCQITLCCYCGLLLC